MVSPSGTGVYSADTGKLVRHYQFQVTGASLTEDKYCGTELPSIITSTSASLTLTLSIKSTYVFIVHGYKGFTAVYVINGKYCYNL